MINVKLEKLTTGMILAKAVYNHQELLLLEAGAKITEKNIRMFKSWGVASVWVRGDSADDSTKSVATAGKSVEAIETELNKKFADVIDDPVMMKIMRAASRVLSKSINEHDEER